MFACRSRLHSWAVSVLLLASPLALSAQNLPGQQPGVEVLARGAVHEGYASTNEFPAPGPVVPKAPPPVVEELPPDQRPAGENVQWIPGYWSWDEERNDFIWISGFWRVAPPGRVWVPGNWRETRQGWQWASGFWQAANQPEQQLEYLPPPPPPLEVAPQVPAPVPTSYYVPGCWVYRGRYVWRPGFWIDHRPGWVWVPACYRWTPAGYVFIEGYWDLPLHDRGVLFAPVAFQPAVIVQPRFVYTPTYVVAQPALVSSLFIRRGFGCYYFGDYFEQRYVNVGFSAWCGSARGTSFAISIGFGRATTYDPNWAYYQLHYRQDPVWVNNVGNLYAARFRGEAPRPPRTLIQQNTVVNNVTNVTNNNIVNNTVTNIINNNTTNNNTVNNIRNNQQALTMVAPLRSAQTFNPAVTLQPVQQDERAKEAQLARQMRDVAAQRTRLESNIVDRQQTPTQAQDRPRQVKLDLPQPIVARAQTPVPTAKAPPPLPTAVQQPRPTDAPPANATVKPLVPPPPAIKSDPKPVAPSSPPGTVKPDPKPTDRPLQLPIVKPEMKPTPVVPPAPPITPKKPEPVRPQPVPPPTDAKPPVRPMTPPPAAPVKVDPKPVPPPPVKVEPKPVPVPAKVDPKPAPLPAPVPKPTPEPVKPSAPIPTDRRPGAPIRPTPPPATPPARPASPDRPGAKPAAPALPAPPAKAPEKPTDKKPVSK